MSLNQKANVKISDEMLKKINALADTGNVGCKYVFTPEQDAIIKEFFKKKNKKQLAEFLNMSESTMRNRYLELTKNGNKN